MKAFRPYLAFSFIIQLSAASLSKAQPRTVMSLSAPPKNISIDGSAREWGDSLWYYNAEKRINYSIANTKDTLYMAVRINDRSEQMRILRAGITFSINPKGKKKENFSITFPLATNGNAPLINTREGSDGKQDHEELMQAVLTVLRGIKAVGFKDIENELITTSNTYGIKTAIDYDDKDCLVCEAAIPIHLFNAGDELKNEWAFNIKINGITRPTSQGQEHAGGEGRGARGSGFGGGGGRRGRGSRTGSSAGPGGSADHNALFTSEDFWEKFYLAKAN